MPQASPPGTTGCNAAAVAAAAAAAAAGFGAAEVEQQGLLAACNAAAASSKPDQVWGKMKAWTKQTMLRLDVFGGFPGDLFELVEP